MAKIRLVRFIFAWDLAAVRIIGVPVIAGCPQGESPTRSLTAHESVKSTNQLISQSQQNLPISAVVKFFARVGAPSLMVNAKTMTV